MKMLEKIKSTIKNKSNDQDFNQKTSVFVSLMLELYRVIISSLLILFVPQSCDDRVCSYSENLEADNRKYEAGLALNFITLFSFGILYFIEVKRENKMIEYLEVNKNLANDNETVGNALEKLDNVRKNKIWDLDYYYQKCGKAIIVLFACNTILSGIVVYDYYLDSKTTITFITNVLFMITKLKDVNSIVNTDKNIFYSAYLKSRVQFNDVDPNKIMILENVSSDLNSNQNDIENVSSDLNSSQTELENEIKNEIKNDTENEIKNDTENEIKHDN
jgi:hypothetical protein